MKKFALIAAALCVACLMAAPAGALEITTDGYYRIQYTGAWNVFMADDASSNAADSFGLQRLRVNGHIKVNDNLGIRTRFRALNTTFGNYNEAGTSGNFDWERAWMYAKFDFGTFQAGRMQGGTWGTAFMDTEVDRDRVRFDSAFGPVAMGLIYEKSAELDNNFKYSDSDLDIVYGYANWKAENMAAGLLIGWIQGKQASDYQAVDILGNPAGTVPLGGNRYYADYLAFLPYFTGKFGPFGIQGEARFNAGKAKEWVNNYDAEGEYLSDADAKWWSINIEGTFDFGMGNAELGYAFASGQKRNDSDVTGTTLGDDWEKMYILTGSTGPNTDPGALGGYGNWSATGGNTDGISMFYGGATFKPMENLSIGGLLAYATADQTDSYQDDSLGWEVDVWATYTVFDNLTNTFKVAYLDAGDYFKGSKYDYARKADFKEDVWAVFNELKLSF